MVPHTDDNFSQSVIWHTCSSFFKWCRKLNNNNKLFFVRQNPWFRLFLHPKNKPCLIATCVENTDTGVSCNFTSGKERQSKVDLVQGDSGGRITSLELNTFHWYFCGSSVYKEIIVPTMRTNTWENPLIIGSTCLVFELQDEKHVAIKLCISTIVVCNYFVLYARSLLAYLYFAQNQLFCTAKQKKPKPAVQYAGYNQKQKTVLWKHTKSQRRCRDARCLFKSKSSYLQRYFFLFNIGSGIKTMNKFLGNEHWCSLPPVAAEVVLHLHYLSNSSPSSCCLSSSCGLGEPPPWTTSRGFARWIPSHSGSSC